MDGILDESLDSGHALKSDSPPPDDALHLADPGEILDPNSLGQYSGLDGQVTYRVVHVANEAEAQAVTSQAQLAQVIQANAFNNGGGSPGNEQIGDQRYAYFAGAGDAGVVQVQGAQSPDVTSVPIGQVTTAGGQFYVMMSPQDVLQNQAASRSIAPRAAFSPKMETGRATRDDRKRATHNEVERRRRDKINCWIVQLSKLVPDCGQEQLKGGSLGVSSDGSKGSILAKACEYIAELKTSNIRLAESIKSTDGINMDTEILRQQLEDLKQENAMLRAQLQQHGILVQTDLNPT